MGKARRRGDKPIRKDRLPDFIFGRNKAVEQAGGFVLAGQLVTDIPKRTKPKRRDSELIASIIQRLVDAARLDPDLQEAGVWRGGRKPDDGLAPPFPAAAMIDRMRRCVVVVVRPAQRRAHRTRRRSLAANGRAAMSKKRPSPAEARFRLNHRCRRELAKWRNEEAIGDPLGFAAAVGRRVRAAGGGDPGLWRRKRDSRRWVKPNTGRRLPGP